MFIQTFKHIYVAIKVTKQVSKAWFYFSITYPIIAGLIPIAELWLMKEFINELVNFISNGTEQRIFELLFLQILLVLIAGILNEVKQYVDKVAESKVGIHVEESILSKLKETQFYHYENPKFFNRLERVQIMNGGTFLSPIKSAIEFLRGSVEIVGIITFFIAIHWLFLFFIIIPVIPAFFAKYKYGVNNYKLNIRHTPLLRETYLIKRLFHQKESFKEIVSFNLGDYLKTRWSKKYQENINATLKLAKKQRNIQFVVQLITGLNLLSVILFIIHLIRKQSLNIGEFVTVIQAIQQGQQTITSITDSMNEILEQSLYLNDYFTFINYRQSGSLGIEEHTFPDLNNKEIHIVNLSFQYPNSPRKALENISLDIRQGEKIAIVGSNGSGKTTLVNCLLGLYPPTSGDIVYDNISIKNINKADLMSNISTLFQNYIKYPFQVRENIGIGNVNEIHNESKIHEKAILSGADEFIQTFKDKYKTFLSKELYQGEDISGGQWQKIAFSRALMKDSQIIILDEPTSALDPLSEKKLFENFIRVTDGQTAIFISHRMTATRFADRIIVMDQGRIIENGSFEELINLKGKFFELYTIQEKSNSNSML